MRLALAALLLLTSCAPVRVVPAVGSRLDRHACFVSSRGVAIYREPAARCPRYEAVEERVRRVEERYGRGLGGAEVTIVAAFVQCAGRDCFGCTIGDVATVQDGPGVMRIVEHELSHVAINRRGGHRDFGHIDLDRRKGER